MASGRSRGRQAIGRATDYLEWLKAGRPFTHGAPGYDAWMQVFDPIDVEPIDVGLISIICPVHDPDPTHLERAIRSALGQTYRPIEVVLVDDASQVAETISVLDRHREHPDVTVVTHDTNRGIAASLNSGIEAARGNIVVFLDHDDELAPDAAAWLSPAFQDARVVYSDEDQLSPEGDRVKPFLKPAWSPILLLGMNYVNHLTAIDRELLMDLGGFDPRFSGAQDHDLLLRVSERGIPVAHVPKVLYHWRQSPGSVAGNVDAKPWALQAARSCVNAALDRRGIDAHVEDAPEVGPYRFSIHFTGTVPTTHVVLAADTLSATELYEIVSATSTDSVMFVAASSPPPDAAIQQLTGWLGIDSIAASGPMVVEDHGRVSDAGWIVSRRTARPYGAGRTQAAEPFLEVAREVSALGGRYLSVRRSDFLASDGFTDGLPFLEAGVELSARIATTTDRVCVIDPTVRLTTTSSAHAEPFRLPDGTGSTRGDMYVSPHVGDDGIEIGDVPTDTDTARLRLRYRLSPAPSTA